LPKNARAQIPCVLYTHDCVALALLACTVFRRGSNAFSKPLRNYAVRVNMLRDLRLAGSTAKRSSLYAATLQNA